MSKLGKKLISAALPDYREFEVPIALSSIQEYMEPLLYQLGYVKDDEEIIKIIGKDLETQDLWITVRLKKHQPVDIITHD